MTWTRQDVADNSSPPEAVEMIIVTPNAGGNIYGGMDYFDMPGWAYETFFFTEFLPYIESTYRVIGNKENRAVAGLSMGGGGATVYGQKHPELFNSVYAMSALMDIPQRDAAPSQRPDDKMAILTKSVQENSAVRFVTEADEERIKTLRSVNWFVDCGDDDFLLDRNISSLRPCAKNRSGMSSGYGMVDIPGSTGILPCTTACDTSPAISGVINNNNKSLFK